MTYPPSLDFKTLKKLLESGDLTKLIGIMENDAFEAKTKNPYDINNSDEILKRKAIASLSGDIASFANNQEAIIVCGLNNKKDQTIRADVVESLDLVEKDNFLQIYKNINAFIQTTIFPKLTVDVKWYSLKEDSSLGVGAIIIPQQPSEKKPFFVTMNEMDGEIIKKTFFGIPVRIGQDPTWKTAQEVHSISKEKPRNLQDVQEAVLSKLDDMTKSLQSIPRNQEDKQKHIQRLIKEMKEDE